MMLAPWKKAMTSILKIRDIALPTKVCLVKALVFPVVMFGCESWTIKKAEWIKDLNARPETIKLLEENIGKKHSPT